MGFPCRRLTTPQLYIILRSNPLENIRDAIHEYLAALEDRMKGAEIREVEVVM